MKGLPYLLKILLILFAIQGFNQASAQPGLHRVIDLVDLPAEISPDKAPGCTVEFQEEWTLNSGTFSISKKVNEYMLSCEDSSDLVFPAEGKLRLKQISYEFSFLDLQMDAGPLLREEAVKKLQADFIELISSRFPFSDLHKPHEELLSIYFHEEWILVADGHEIIKQVKGITPVIWQQRQTADGKAIHDAETGYPVYYKLKLGRIDLRQP
jgi:hypothetical protein